MTSRLRIGLCVLLACGAGAASAERVQTIDLRGAEGQVLAIGEAGLVLRSGSANRTLPLGDLEEVFLREAQDLMAAGGQTVVVTAVGDILAAKDLEVADGKMRLDSPMAGKVEMPLSAVSYVYLPARGEEPAALARRCAELRPPSAAADVLIVDHGKELSAIEGILVALGGGKITFRLREEDRQVETRHVKAIRLATPGGQWQPAGRVVAADGSELLFSSVALQENQLTVQTRAAGVLSIDRKNVAAIRFVSGRVTPLAEVKPQQVQEHGFFERPSPHRLNRAVSGKPLLLKGRRHETGLGLASYTRLTYALDGQYKSFVAIAGIDDEVRPLGNATVTFLGDGKELAKPLILTGKDDPVEVRLDLTGVRTFVVQVDFGPDSLPVGDHVDLASARLIK